jgi:hypothetical protein
MYLYSFLRSFDIKIVRRSLQIVKGVFFEAIIAETSGREIAVKYKKLRDDILYVYASPLGEGEEFCAYIVGDRLGLLRLRQAIGEALENLDSEDLGRNEFAVAMPQGAKYAVRIAIASPAEMDRLVAPGELEGDAVAETVREVLDGLYRSRWRGEKASCLTEEEVKRAVRQNASI